MAGTHLHVAVDDAAVRRALERLMRRGSKPSDALKDAGEALINSHRERFRSQQAPDGSPWEPLSKKYQARKRRNKNKILVLDGHMGTQFSYKQAGNDLKFGTNRVQAAAQHFGRKEINLPARPFLGLSDDDRKEVMRIFESHIRG